jgi:hypothetical protein
MGVPPWLALSIGILVVVWGAFRIYIGIRPPPSPSTSTDEGIRRTGLFGLPRRTQILVGIIYLLLGAMLILPALGVRLPLPWLKH